MYETVLWATDASTVADGALAEAVELLKSGGRLIAFHCDERFAGGAPLLADEFDGRGKIVAQVDQLKADGIDAELVIETTHHDAAREIAKIAEEQGVDVIVCGTRGFGFVPGVLGGSVAMRLPHLAPCAVVVVSEKAAENARATETAAVG